jgi:hypothetical protein
MITCISYTVSAMDIVDLPLRISGNDMHFAKHLSTYALVSSKERLQNVNKDAEKVKIWQQCNVAHV